MRLIHIRNYKILKITKELAHLADTVELVDGRRLWT